MPQNLRELVIHEVSLVDNPANAEKDDLTGKKIPRACIALFKRDVEKVAGVKFVIGFPNGGGGSQVQAVLFDKDMWDVVRAKQWLKDHDFGGLSVDETENKLRFRQKDPDQFSRLRTIEPGTQKMEGDDVNKAKEILQGKTEDGKVFPKSDFAYTPSDQPSEWKLRLTAEPGGEPDAQVVGAAVAALGPGFRGNKVQIPAEALSGVKAKVRAAWRKIHSEPGAELPAILKQGDSMTIEQLEEAVTKQEARIATIQAENAELKKSNAALEVENDLVFQMSKEDREVFALMPKETRTAYVVGDVTKRAELMQATVAKREEDALFDTMDAATKSEFQKAGPEKRKLMLEVAGKAEEDKKKKTKSKMMEGANCAEDEEEEVEMKKRDDANLELVKKLADAEDRLAKNDARWDRFQKAERLVIFTKMAQKELSHTSGTDEEKGQMLMDMADTLPGGENGASFKKYCGALSAADKTLSVHFGEVGKSGGPIEAEKAMEAKAIEIAKRDSISKEKAMDRVLLETPDLYYAYREEQQHKSTRRFA